MAAARVESVHVDMYSRHDWTRRQQKSCPFVCSLSQNFRQRLADQNFVSCKFEPRYAARMCYCADTHSLLAQIGMEPLELESDLDASTGGDQALVAHAKMDCARC